MSAPDLIALLDHIDALEAENARLVKERDQARAGRRLLSDQGMDIGAMFMNAQVERDAAEADREALRVALRRAETVMMIVEPRNHKAEYMEALDVVRGALAWNAGPR